MTDFLRTPDENFTGLDGFAYEPCYHAWQDLRMHYIDVGPATAPAVLLLHGMPTWCYLYRHMIPVLTEAGFRCIAPDHIGFGRSDKPTDPHWYTIARHTEILTSLICALDLQDVTLVCQDWGGPIGLAQAVTMPGRFARLVIMNTWLHHPDYVYTTALRDWNRMWHAGGRFAREKPDMGLMMAMTAGLVEPAAALSAFATGVEPPMSARAAAMCRAYRAPVAGLADAGYNGMRRFPLSLPFDNAANGNAAMQTHCYDRLLAWNKPVHFIWGCRDEVFPETWGRAWAERMGASFDAIVDAGHFLQNTHGREVADIILRRSRKE
jgi:haloalkane dehalogenase